MAGEIMDYAPGSTPADALARDMLAAAQLCASRGRGVQYANDAGPAAENEFGPLAAKHFAQASLAYTQAFLSLSGQRRPR